MSQLVGRGVVLSNSSGAVVTVSGGALGPFNDSSSPWDSRCGLQVNTDGTIDEYGGINGSFSNTQIDASTDWIIPNSAANSSYECRLDVTIGSPAAASDSTGTWLAISSNRLWYIERAISGFSTLNWTLRIRFNGGAELDSAVYTGSINNS